MPQKQMNLENQVIEQIQNLTVSEGQNPEVIKNQFKSKPLIISGCSGAGKGTLVKFLLSQYPELFELSVSHTTRKARPGQMHGRQYHFVDQQFFEKQGPKDVFIQYGRIYGNYYGTHKSELDRIASKNKICILEIDLTAAQKIYGQKLDCNFLFIDVPQFEVLRQRMRNRGTQTQQKIETRMNHSKLELEKIKELTYYSKIMNEKIQKTKIDLLEFINTRYGLSLSN